MLGYHSWWSLHTHTTGVLVQRTPIATFLACVAAAACAASLAAPASAARTESQYVLSVSQEEAGERRQVSLNCDSVSGTHPRAEEACEMIEKAGSIEGIPPEHGMCTMEHRPVTVTALGAEEYTEVFGNACQLELAKGAVFDF